MNPLKDFRARKTFKLREEDAGLKPLSTGDKSADKKTVLELSERIAGLQNVFYANGQRKFLLILQGMDTSGKDGAVSGVFGRVDPLGVRCVAFRAPTEVEKAHDFLWRVHQQVPAARELVVFNRSHYEDVLVPGVMGWIDATETGRRLAHIRDFERMLAETGTVIVKCFLHISKEEQKERLQERIDNPDKHWKFDLQDIEQRKSWDDFQAAYQKAIRATDAEHAPWYIIPADSKTHRNLVLAHIVLAHLERMELKYPPAKPELAGLQIE